MFETYYCNVSNFELICVLIDRVIHKSLRDFRPLRYSSRDGHAEGEHVKRATHVQRVWQELDYRTDICRVTKGGHIEHL